MNATSPFGITLKRAIEELRRPGEGELPGEQLWGLGRWFVTLVIVITNVIGAAAVLGIANFVVPLPALAHASHVRRVDTLLAAAYVIVADRALS